MTFLVASGIAFTSCNLDVMVLAKRMTMYHLSQYQPMRLKSALFKLASGVISKLCSQQDQIYRWFPLPQRLRKYSQK